MIGPVLRQELLLGGRRGRWDALRRLFTSWLVLQFCFYFGSYCFDIWRSMLDPPDGPGRMDITASGRFAEAYVAALVTQQFVLLFLLTPGFVAGAITDEKSRGTLQYLLTADLTSGEIIIGKLVGRLFYMGLLCLASLPLLALMAPYANFNLFTIFALAVAVVLVLSAVGAASMLASIWGRQTRDAVIALYLLGGCGALVVVGLRELSVAFPTWTFLTAAVAQLDAVVDALSPLHLLEPASAAHQDVPEFARRLLAALLAWGGLAGICVALAVWRLRPAYMRQLECGSTQRKDAVCPARATASEDEPIRWKEQQVEGIAPLPMLRLVPRAVGVAVVFIAALAVSTWNILSLTGTGPFLQALEGGAIGPLLTRLDGTCDAQFWAQSMAVITLAALIVGVRCSGAITGERERRTWEALLLTPLPVRELVRGKLRGIMNATRPYLIAYALATLSVAWLAGVTAVVWTLLGVLAAWPAIYYVGAIGLYNSARSASSWRSLFATISVSSVTGFFICAVTGPLIAIASLLLLSCFGPFGWAARAMSPAWGILALTVCLVSCWTWLFWGRADRYLRDAQQRVIGRERTSYWVGGVNCGYATELFMRQFESKRA
ncbi:MAG: ABC transporter permease subunit [Gemmataceae bacterium]|nr:ABC transporter permease subunit [Gemmataceae bacterium]